MKEHLFFKRASHILATLLLALLIVACDLENGSGTIEQKVFLPCEIVDVTEDACVIGNTSADAVSVDDPLAEYQWHLNNTGQPNFASNGGTFGADLNMLKAIESGCTGKRVLVAVVDSGLEIAHEDLADNAPENCSFDMLEIDVDPTPVKSYGDHGTSVAGLIAAVKDNGKGGRGIAPQAKLKGFNLLADGVSSGTANEILTLGGADGSIPGFISNDVHIFNMSYGSNPVHDTAVNNDMEAHLIYGTTSLRGGKGAIYVKAGGNEYAGLEGNDTDCAATNAEGLGCYNANMEPTQTLPYLIVVGALNANGVKSSYSNTGSALWISAPGGEFGQSDPAMLTTDLSGCDKGYAKAGSNTIVDSECNYMHDFNGTSSATPVVTGVIALMLEANPELTWRDVKHILAKTAEKTDSDKALVSIATANGYYTALLPWITNQAGFNYHNWYGFGAADVDAALTEIKTYTAGSLGTFQTLSKKTRSGLSIAIPDADATGASDTINISDAPGGFVIEEVIVKVSATHSYTGDLGIELSSPHGTKSILLNTGSRLQDDVDLYNMRLLSNAFYGETTVNGDWTVKVVDAASGDSGTLTGWKLIITGHVNGG